MRKRTQNKKQKTDQQTENLKLFLKTGNGPKKRGNGPKKEETNQQTENLKLFLKTGNGSKSKHFKGFLKISFKWR